MDISDLQDDFMDEDELSVPSLLKQLTAQWVNEKNAPVLLPYSSEIVDCMMDQVDQMEENLDKLGRDDFRVMPHRMEVNRIRFILASYHRCRLEKIETFASYLVKNHETSNEALMSPGELKFAKEFLEHRDNYFHNEAYKYIPELLNETLDSQDEGISRREVVPNTQSSVFIEIVKPNLPSILVNDTEEIALPLGSRHLLPYDDVSGLINVGHAVLI